MAKDDERCGGCGEVIPPTAQVHTTEEGERLCAGCAPTYADMLACPGSFRGLDGSPLTEETAARLFHQHEQEGGFPSDPILAPLAGGHE